MTAPTSTDGGPARQWLIWSMEHRLWWGHNGCGYTKWRKQAGRYSEADALAIVADGNCGAPEDRPHEAMILDAQRARADDGQQAT